MSTRKTLDDSQDPNPSPKKKQRKAQKPLFGQPKSSKVIARVQPKAPIPPIQKDEDLLELDLGNLLDNFTISDKTKNVNKYKKAFDSGLRLKRESTALDTSTEPTLPTGRDEQATPTAHQVTHAQATTLEERADQNLLSNEEATTAGYEETHHGAQTLEKHVDQNLSLKVYDWDTAPIRSNRAFEIVDVSTQNAWYKAKGDARASAQSLSCWKFEVRDGHDGPVFEVYGVLPGQLTRTRGLEVRGGPLTTDIFASEEDVRQLGKVVCQLLDRFPYDLDAQQWNSFTRGEAAHKQNWHVERRLVQARAIDLYRLRFDRTQLLPPFRELELPSRLAAASERPEGPRNFTRAVRCLFDDPSHRVFHDPAITVSVNIDLLDPDKVNALPDVPPTFPYKMSSLPKLAGLDKHDFSESEEALVLKAFSNIQYNIAFKVGTPTELLEHARTEFCKLFKPDADLEKTIARDLENNRAANLRRDRFKAKGVGFGVTWTPITSSFTLRPYAALHRTSNRVIPDIIVSTASRVKAAHVCNRWASTYINDKANCLKSALATAIAADEVNCKGIDESQVKKEYCRCNDTADRESTMHTCMDCFLVFPCANLATTADSRRICEATCAKVPSIMHSSTPMSVTAVKQRIANSVRNSRAMESDYEGSTTELCLQKAFTNIVDLEKGEYNDAYCDQARTDGLSLTEPHNTRSRPMFVSVDAVHQMVMLHDHVVLHTPTNIVCTPMAVNYMKGVWGVHIVPAMHAAAQQTQKETASGQRDSIWWADWHICLDRLHHLCLLVPHRRVLRLRLTSREVDADTLSEYLECLRSSFWQDDQGSPIDGYSGTSPATDGELVPTSGRDKGILGKPGLNTKKKRKVAKEYPPIWHAWTDEEIAQIIRMIKEIEADPRANPARLKLPRLADGAPWPFRLDHILSDDVNPWDWLFREMLYRYTRMWWLCDLLHDTSESPMTLLLELVVQWFARRGGVDQFIHCEMTVFRRHPLRYSFGRKANVQPGSPMRTGFTETSPTSFREHYDESRSTVVVQPCIINALWSNFDPSEHDNIFKLLLSLAPVTIHYRAYQRSGSTPTYSKETSISRRLRRGQADDVVEHDSDREDDDEDEPIRYDDDDEDEATALDMNIDKSGDLWLEYLEIEDFVDDYFVDDKSARLYVDTLKTAVRTDNSNLFETSHSLLYLQIKAKCCVCNERIASGKLLRCSNRDHKQALFHEECVPEGVTMLCPTCHEDQEDDPHQGFVAPEALATGIACEHCSERFNDEVSLSIHVRDRHYYQGFVAPEVLATDIACEHCSERFDDQASLSVHVRDVHHHQGVAPEAMTTDIACEHCSERFDDQASLSMHIGAAHQAPAHVQPGQPPESSISTTESLQQLLLKFGQQQATFEQQQKKMEQQQSTVDRQQREQDARSHDHAKVNEQHTERQAKMNEQQATIDRQQRELDVKFQQLNEQQTKQQTKIDEQQSTIDGQQRKLDAKLQRQEEQRKNLVQRELDMLAHDDEHLQEFHEMTTKQHQEFQEMVTKQHQDWQGMIARRKEDNKARADELRASLLG
jgi:hypothetical protein